MDEGMVDITPEGRDNGVWVVVLILLMGGAALIFGGGYAVGSWSARQIRADYADALVVMANQDRALKQLTDACSKFRGICAQQTEDLKQCNDMLELDKIVISGLAHPVAQNGHTMLYPSSRRRP